MAEVRIGLQDYLTIVVRRRWYVIVPCAVIVCVTMLIGLFLPKVYRAEALVLIENPQIMNPLLHGMAIPTSVEERLRVVQEQLVSWPSMTRLVEKLGLDQGVTTPIEYERLIKRLKNEIVILASGAQRGSLIRIFFDHYDPAMAQKVVNTVTEVYLERNVEAQDAEAQAAIDFIESQLGVYKTKLEGSEKAMRDFQELYRRHMPVAEQLNEEIQGEEFYLARLLVENTREHPAVVATMRKIDELKRSRNEQIRQTIASALAKDKDSDVYRDLVASLGEPGTGDEPLDPTIQAGKAAYEALVARLENQSKPGDVGSQQLQVLAPTGSPDGMGMSIVTLPPNLQAREDQELARLQRDYSIHSDTYGEMKQRLELANITHRLGQSDQGMKFKIIEPARLPLRHAYPDLGLMFLYALLGGLVVGVGVAFGVEFLDESFQTAEEAQGALALPVLGSISRIVTEGDLDERRRRVKYWLSFKAYVDRFRSGVLQPLWARVDNWLVRFGL